MITTDMGDLMDRNEEDNLVRCQGEDFLGEV